MKKLNQSLAISVSFLLIFTPLLQAIDVQVDGTTNTTLDTSKESVK